MKFFDKFSKIFNGTGKPNKIIEVNFEDCKTCRQEFCQMGNNDFCRK